MISLYICSKYLEQMILECFIASYIALEAYSYFYITTF